MAEAGDELDRYKRGYRLLEENYAQLLRALDEWLEDPLAAEKAWRLKEARREAQVDPTEARYDAKGTDG